MRTFLIVFLIGITQSWGQFGSVVSYPNGAGTSTLNKSPEFYLLDWQKGTNLSAKETTIQIMVDSLGAQKVNLLVDHKNRPILYNSHIITPVCADGDCKLMHITFYWTLLGDYAGFDRSVEEPLTKHDHDEFVYADYWKLHELLKDHNSILKRRAINELVEKPKPSEMEGVDALSGATVKEVKESVVGGALYSCYVAWHLVHGPIKEAIKEYSSKLQDNDMLLGMLESNHTNYQMHALTNLNKEDYKKHLERIAELFKTGIPLVRSFIIKNMSDFFKEIPEEMRPFWEALPEIDINSRSLLLQHLENIPENNLLQLTSNLGVLTKNQLRLVLDYLEEKEPLSDGIKINLGQFAGSSKEKHAYLVSQYLGEN